ncbi:MAG TPA: hypothetical protein VF746_10895 [Longimicrobium sp.]|jgi:hypothetical protein
MPVTIENRSDTRVLLRLNSGQNWYLGPGEALDVEPVEVKGNAWLQRLEERRLIAVDRGEGGEDGPREGGQGQQGEQGEQEQPAASGEPLVEGQGALSAEAATPVGPEDEPPTSPRPRRIRPERGTQ